MQTCREGMLSNWQSLSMITGVVMPVIKLHHLHSGHMAHDQSLQLYRLFWLKANSQKSGSDTNRVTGVAGLLATLYLGLFVFLQVVSERTVHTNWKWHFFSDVPFDKTKLCLFYLSWLQVVSNFFSTTSCGKKQQKLTKIFCKKSLDFYFFNNFRLHNKLEIKMPQQLLNALIIFCKYNFYH